jgi:hypothetical protein
MGMMMMMMMVTDQADGLQYIMEKFSKKYVTV